MCPVLTQCHEWGTKWVLSSIPHGSLCPHATIFLKKETMCSQVLRLSPRKPLSLPSTSRAEQSSILGVGPASHHPDRELWDTGSCGTRGVRGHEELDMGCWETGSREHGVSGDMGSQGT